MTVKLSTSGKMNRIFGGTCMAALQYILWWMIFHTVSAVLQHLFATVGIILIGIFISKAMATTYCTDATSLKETGTAMKSVDYSQVTSLSHHGGDQFLQTRNSYIRIFSEIEQREEFMRLVLQQLAAVKDVTNIRMRGKVEEIRRLLTAA